MKCPRERRFSHIRKSTLRELSTSALQSRQLRKARPLPRAVLPPRTATFVPAKRRRKCNSKSRLLHTGFFRQPVLHKPSSWQRASVLRRGAAKYTGPEYRPCEHVRGQSRHLLPGLRGVHAEDGKHPSARWQPGRSSQELPGPQLVFLSNKSTGGNDSFRIHSKRSAEKC